MSAGRFTARSPFLRGRSSALDADLINRLRKLPVGPTPDARFKADLRSQLVSITARIVSESSTAVDTRPSRVAAGKSALKAAVGGASLGAGARPTISARPSTSARTSRRFGGPVVAHPIASVTSLLAAFAIVIVSLSALSSSALPGDALYSFKRTSENVQLSLASGNRGKGHEYLQQATERLSEAQALLARGTGARNQSLVAEALADADTASRNGMQSMGRAVVKDVSVEPLDDVDAWVITQRAMLQKISAAASGTPTSRNASASLALLDRIAARSTALRAKAYCPCLTTSNSDDLGPLPCEPCRSTPAVAPGLSTTAPNSTTPGSKPGTTAPGSSSQSVQNSPSGSLGSLGSTLQGGVPGTSVPGGVHITLPTSGLPPLPSIAVTPLPGVTVATTDGLYVGADGLLKLLGLK